MSNPFPSSTPSAQLSVPKNLKYDQTSTSTVAEFLVATQSPEGKSEFGPGEKIDFRFSMTGGYVTSWASSTFDFDLEVGAQCETGAGNNIGKYAFAGFDPYLGAHQLIERIVVTAGGNIIEDFRNYPQIYKTQRAMHSNKERAELDRLNSEDSSTLFTREWKPLKLTFGNFDTNASTPVDTEVFMYYANDFNSEAYTYAPILTVGPNAAGSAGTAKTKTIHCRLNLLSCLGSLAGAKYWPNVLLNSDVRLEIYLQSNKFEGMILPTGLNTANYWKLKNTKYTLSNVRLNSNVINSIRNQSNVSMILPGYTTVTHTLQKPTTNGVYDNLQYSSSATSLKQLLLLFRDPADIATAARNSYAFLEPMGLQHQFLIGSNLQPARPVTMLSERAREFTRCLGGPSNSTEHRTLIRTPNYFHQPTTDTADSGGTRDLTYFTNEHYTVRTCAPCHILGHSLEAYADHTLSSTVFSGDNAVNLIMQAQLLMKLKTSRDATEIVKDLPGTSVSNDIAWVVDTIMVYDRILEFKGGEVVMGY